MLFLYQSFNEADACGNSPTRYCRLHFTLEALDVIIHM